MRYLHVGKIRSMTNAGRRNRLRPEDMSDYMLRDIGVIDGQPPAADSGPAADSRSRQLDLLTLTPYAS
jgi:hypothetical protein